MVDVVELDVIDEVVVGTAEARLTESPLQAPASSAATVIVAAIELGRVNLWSRCISLLAAALLGMALTTPCEHRRRDPPLPRLGAGQVRTLLSWPCTSGPKSMR